MTEWTPQQLEPFAAAVEVTIAVDGTDGKTADPVTIWAVRVDDDLFVRAYTGSRSRWWRAVLASGRGTLTAADRSLDITAEPADPVLADYIDEAYADKYGANVYVDAMVTDAARETTLRLRPAG